MSVSSGAPEAHGFVDLPAFAVTGMVWAADVRLRNPLVLAAADGELVSLTIDLKAAAGDCGSC